MRVATLLLLACAYWPGTVCADTEHALRAVLERGVAAHTFPGAVALVGTGAGDVLFAGAVGRHTYDHSSPAASVDETWFDLASSSKVLSTTQAVALLYQRGYLGLDTRVRDVLGAEYARGGKDNVTVRHCLLHNAGYRPDHEPWYWSTEFGCPNTLDEAVPREDWSCVGRVYASLLDEPLVRPPGQAFNYSDLSMITLQFVVGKLAWESDLVPAAALDPACADAAAQAPGEAGLLFTCHFEALARTWVFENPVVATAGAAPLRYRLPKAQWPLAAPTENDTEYLHHRIQGQVSDGNCYAMGGICGHAGVFARAPAVGRLLAAVASAAAASAPDDTPFVNGTTAAVFTALHNESQSSRALGWDTNANIDDDKGYHHSCGTWPTTTFMHIGYTGTCVCGLGDAADGFALWSVILTNRVFNCEGQSCTDSSLSAATETVYRQFNSVAWAAYGESRRRADFASASTARKGT